MTTETFTSTSNSTITPIPKEIPSATNTGSYEALLKQYIEAAQKPQTVGQIRASGEVRIAEAEAKRIEGETKNKFTVLIIIGVISLMLTLFGCSIFIVNPEISKDVWVIIGPILTAGISGTIGFLTGEKQGASREYE